MKMPDEPVPCRNKHRVDPLTLYCSVCGVDCSDETVWDRFNERTNYNPLRKPKWFRKRGKNELVKD